MSILSWARAPVTVAVSTPILALPSIKQPFILYTDASMTAMGAVLSQMQDGWERTICQASKASSKVQTKYSATKRELLAVVNFTRHFTHYLLGRQFKIVTDHSGFQWLHNFKNLDALTTRWLENFATFKTMKWFIGRVKPLGAPMAFFTRHPEH